MAPAGLWAGKDAAAQKEADIPPACIYILHRAMRCRQFRINEAKQESTVIAALRTEEMFSMLPAP